MKPDIDGSTASSDWPALPLDAWRATRDTLHMWTQIVGKIRLALATPVNHWWHVPLYVTARGLTTSAMHQGGRALQIDFDFHDHQLVFSVSDGQRAVLPLQPRSVAAFHRAVMATVEKLGFAVNIWPVPVEVPYPVPFDDDEIHNAYDAVYARRFWQVLLRGADVLERHRARFLGKSSPVHFFWGSFDLAVTFFSGRSAPAHPGVAGVARQVMVEAYSRELASWGLWPGDGRFPRAAFYAYTYPAIAGFAETHIKPDAAFHDGEMGEFLLPYDAVRGDDDPAAAVKAFLDSTYDAAARLGQWDRAVLERARA